MIEQLESSFDELLNDKTEKSITLDLKKNHARMMALISEYNLLYAEYVKYEENTRGVEKISNFLASDRGRKLLKVVTKLKLLRHFK